MAISLTRYVDITSGVGAGNDVATRQLIGRFFTENPLVPTGSFVTMTSADEVNDYFGSFSEEFGRAAFYFGWISKNITNPPAMSFARWANVATAPQIFGSKGAQSVASWTSITTGSFTLQLGATTHTLSTMDFSAAASLSDVAAVVQAKIRTQTGSMWTAATVVWDSTRQSFDFTGGLTGAAVVVVTPGGGGNDIASQLGWLADDTILSDGAAAQSITDVLSESAGADNNFGSFAFMPTLTLDQVVEGATWNQTLDNEFLYSVRVAVADASDWSSALLLIGGITLTLASPVQDEFPEQVPMMIEAATDYTARNSVQNYMFQIFDLTPSVTTDASADMYDELRINYYGQTQTAGQLIQFYQRGLMMGQSTDPLDQNVYVNEIWLKDASAAAIMTILLSLTEIPANAAGRAQLLVILQSVIDQALLNGTIEAGKFLTPAQKLFIGSITGNPLAWLQVQNNGYWVDARIVSEVIDSVTQYKAVYTLIYGKNDVIRKVEGRDILI